MAKKKTTKKAVKKAAAKRSAKAAPKKKTAAKTTRKKATPSKTKAKAKPATKAKAKPATKAKAKSTTKAKAKSTTKAKAKSTTKAKAKVKAKAKAGSTKTTAKKSTRKASSGPNVKKAVAKTAKKVGTKTARKAAAPKKSTATSTAPPLPESPPRKLKAKELREFRLLLLQKRAELVGDVTQLTDEALKGTSSGGQEHSAMPIHMADVGSDNWEKEFNLIQIDHERDIVREIDEALDRIENKTYGMCLATNRPISIARLRAKPWAKYCIDYRRALEEGSAQ